MTITDKERDILTQISQTAFDKSLKGHIDVIHLQLGFQLEAGPDSPVISAGNMPPLLAEAIPESVKESPLFLLSLYIDDIRNGTHELTEESYQWLTRSVEESFAGILLTSFQEGLRMIAEERSIRP